MPEREDLPLTAEHLTQLREGSGISEDVIVDRGYRSIATRSALREYGFSAAQCKAAPGLLIPQHGTDGSNSRYIFRPDQPRVFFDKKSGEERIIKYETPKDAGIRLDCPPRCRADLGNPSVELWITEGSKKADAGASRGLCILALNGVWGFKGKNEFGGVTVLVDWDSVAIKERTINIVFDNDVMVKFSVKHALERLTEFLKRKGATVNCVYLPHGDDGAKTGLDDYLLRHTIEDLRALVELPRPVVKAAPAQVELLEVAPATIDRPLILLDGKAHAAIWPFVRITVRETNNAEGEIVRHDPPIERTERRIMIVRSDGAIFGDGKRNLEEVGAEIHLPEMPLEKKLWSATGVIRWASGKRPSPADVFNRIVEIVDRFIDFDRSLADQREMCEMISCFILSTWFLDAFNVIGYVWPNGERGSGKTQLLVLLAELGYLGQFILAAGSFAALRDLADYGALLCFDDAENLSDPKTTDPDKRMLLLAGNRRGSTVPVKEPSPEGAWRTRHVKTYCPRAFSAIRLPDGVLASRTITTPLVRSGDKRRANADPLEYDLWPHDRQTLIDDLWALAVTRLPELGAYERRVNNESNLMGRNLEPWRAILAVALWLDENGVEGLAERMKTIAGDYQVERAEFETSDLTRLVVSTICTICTSRTSSFLDTGEYILETAEIAKEAKKLATDDEWALDPETVNSLRVAKILSRLRLKQPKTRKRGEARKWIVPTGELVRWKSVYSIFDEKEQGGPETTGATGVTGELVQDGPEGDLPFTDPRPEWQRQIEPIGKDGEPMPF